MLKFSQYIIGLDEAGRGPWAGPLVAAAFVCTKDDFSELEKLGVKDSKKITHKKREKIFKYLKEKYVIGLGQTTAREIDSLGLQRANVLALERAILKLPSQFQSLPITLDYIGAFKNYFTLLNQWQMFVGGELVSPAIAAASICAKVVRDKLMEEYDKKYPDYNFSKHKGYGTKGHQEVLKNIGPSFIHRKSFQPIKYWLKKSGV